MQNSILRKDDNGTKLNWFWTITTKAWFFPVYYLLLAFLLYIVLLISGDPAPPLALFLFYIILSMPIGLIYITYIPFYGLNDKTYQDGSTLFYFMFIGFYLFFALTISLVQNFKNKKNKILKWMIIILLILITLSFLGCGLIIKFVK